MPVDFGTFLTLRDEFVRLASFYLRPSGPSQSHSWWEKQGLGERPPKLWRSRSAKQARLPRGAMRFITRICELSMARQIVLIYYCFGSNHICIEVH